MTTHKKTSAKKLLIRFDNELKTILVNDLNNAKVVKHQFMNNTPVQLQVR